MGAHYNFGSLFTPSFLFPLYSRPPSSLLFTHALLPLSSLLTPSSLFPLYSRPPPSFLFTHALLPLSSLLTPSSLFSPISAFSLPLIFPNFLSSLLSPLPFFHPSIYFIPPIPISDCQVTFRTSRVPSRWPSARVFAPSRRPSAVSSPSTSSLLR